jgi:hypothetical protein
VIQSVEQVAEGVLILLEDLVEVWE